MKNLKALRKSENLTLQALADALDLTPQVLSRYERGDHEADYKTLQRIAQFFNVSIDYLLGYKLLTETKQSPPKKEPLPLDEERLLQDYRGLSYIGKARVVAYADLIKEQETDASQTAPPGSARRK